MYRNTALALFCLAVLGLALRGCGKAPLPLAGRGLPDLAEAKALSNHYVEVTFTAAPGEQAADPGAYSIIAVDGAVLPVTAARISDEAAKVILTTGPQEEVEYRLSISDAGEIARSESASIPTRGVTPIFTGSLVGEPYLSSAISLGPTRVLLTFSERMDGMVNVVPFYRIAAPDLEIVAASQVEGEIMAILTTETQENIEYTVKVTNVASLEGGILIDPTRCTASFYGIPPDDTEGPTLTGAACTSATGVLLSFSEPLDDQAADPINFDIYSEFGIDPDPVIIGAELTTYATQVLLSTLPLTAEVEYTVSVTKRQRADA